MGFFWGGICGRWNSRRLSVAASEFRRGPFLALHVSLPENWVTREHILMIRTQRNAIGIFLIVIFAMLSGCSSQMLKSDADPNVDLTQLKQFYVRKLPADGRGVEKLIASQLTKMGFQATSGTESKPPGPVDAIVSYEDRWVWDITMYMLQIEIKLHDPKTDFIFATGVSQRTSLVRKSPEFMIDEVLREIFGRGADEDKQ